MPHHEACVDTWERVARLLCRLQPIKIKLRQNQVESAIVCQIKTEHNVGLVRLEAMHKRTPVFTFMFGRGGNLLNSNTAAMTKFGVKSVGRASARYIVTVQAIQQPISSCCMHFQTAWLLNTWTRCTSL